METKITITLTFSGDRKLSKQEIWEIIDSEIQDETWELDGADFFIKAEPSK